MSVTMPMGGSEVHESVFPIYSPDISYLRMGREGPFLLPVPSPIHHSLLLQTCAHLFAGALLSACMALFLPGPTGTVWLLALGCLQFGLNTLRLTQPKWDEGPQGVIVGLGAMFSGTRQGVETLSFLGCLIAVGWD